MTPRLVLFLPAKDEAPNLPDLIRRAWEAGFSHVVVCDDGSQDGTGDVARGLGATVLVHPVNLGLGEALKTLFTWASERLGEEEVAVFMDADGTMDPKQALLGTGPGGGGRRPSPRPGRTASRWPGSPPGPPRPGRGRGAPRARPWPEASTALSA